MGLSFVEVLPEIKIPASMIFSYPTALGDTLRPAIERILLPEEYLHPLQVKVDVNSGDTGPRKLWSKRAKLRKALYKAVKGVQVLDCPENFLFDGRQELDINIGHVIENLAAPALFAKQMLSKRLGQDDIDVHVILREQAPNLAREVFETLGVPVICTDDSVYGEVISLSVARSDAATSPEALQFTPIINKKRVAEIDSKLYNLYAALFNEAEFSGCESLGVEKIFIPRKGNRCLSNNDEVTEFLESKGFKTHYFEDLTCAQKWSITRDVKVVVAVHGAALSHMAFNRLGLQAPDRPGSGVKVVELYSPGWASRWAHRRQISGLNGRWCGVRGQVTPESLKTIDFSNLPRERARPSQDSFKVDCTSLQMALDYLDV